jgi:hypothetical protein
MWGERNRKVEDKGRREKIGRLLYSNIFISNLKQNLK